MKIAVVGGGTAGFVATLILQAGLFPLILLFLEAGISNASCLTK